MGRLKGKVAIITGAVPESGCGPRCCSASEVARAAAVDHDAAAAEETVRGNSLATCRDLGLGFVCFAPLVRGLLLGRYRRGEEPAKGTRMESFPGEASR